MANWREPTMEEAHRADMKAERLMREAARAIDAVLDHEHRVDTDMRVALEVSRGRLREQAAHIVAVWD